MDKNVLNRWGDEVVKNQDRFKAMAQRAEDDGELTLAQTLRWAASDCGRIIRQITNILDREKVLGGGTVETATDLTTWEESRRNDV